MKKQSNQQRVVAAATAFALVATQLPAPALAEIASTGAAEETAEEQVTEDGTSGDETNEAEVADDTAAETEAPEQKADADAETTESTTEDEGAAPSDDKADNSSNDATESKPDADAQDTTEQEDVSLAIDVNETTEAQIHAGQISANDLFKNLGTLFSKSAGLSCMFRLKSNNTGEKTTLNYFSSGDLTLSGSYTVDYSMNAGWTWSESIGRLSTYWDVTFSAVGCEQGGVVGDAPEQVNDGGTLKFTPRNIESFRIKSVTSNGTELSADLDSTYTIENIGEDINVVITYEAYDTANVDVSVRNATASLFGATVSTNGNVTVGANVEGSLTVTPDNGYAVTGATFDGKSLPLTYSDHKATVSLGSLDKDSNHTLVVTTVKCGLVAKAETIDAGLAGRDASDYKQVIFNAALDTVNSVPSDLTLNDVEITYNAGGSYGWKDLSWEPEWYEKIFGAHAFDAAEGGSNQVRITYAGNDQYYGSGIELTVNVIDARPATHIEMNDTASVQYDADFDAMKKTLFDQLSATVYNDETGDAVDGLTQDDFELDGLEHAVGDYTVTLKYKGRSGENGLKPSEATAAVTVTKAPSSTSVTNKRVTYDGNPVDTLGLVSTSPSNDETKPLVIVAGIDGDAKGYISVDLSYVDPTVQSVVNSTFHLDEGVSVNTLNGYLNNDAVVAGLKLALKFAGVADPDALVSSLQKVVSTLVDLGLGESTVALGGSPSNAGVYLVAGVTTSGNYETSMDLGYLTIAPQHSEISLAFTNTLGRTVTKGEAAGFDYSVKVNGAAAGDAANLLVTFAGTSYAGEAYLQSVTLKSTDADMAAKLAAAAPTEPGVYTQTATTLGGNYFATPVSRAYAIARGASSMTLDGFENGTRTTTYNGEAQPATATVYDENGEVIESARVTCIYTGTSLNGKKSILSTKAPTEAGTYKVQAVYLGDATRGSTSATGTIVINPAQVKLSLGTLATVYGDSVDHAKQMPYSVDGEPAGSNGLLSQQQVDAILATVNCEGDDHNHDANENPGYTVTATVPESVAADKNLNVSVASGLHTVSKRALKVVVADVAKLYGESDPSFGAVVYDAKTGAALDNQEQLLKSLGMQYSREEGEEPGAYKISATYTNGNVEATVVAGTLTIVPGLTVKTNGIGTATADKRGAAEGEQISVTAKPTTSAYVFTGWVVTEGDATVANASAAETTVTMGSKNATIVANFSTKETPANGKRKVTVYADEGGTASSTPKGAEAGETVNLKAKAHDGHEFDYWEVVSGNVELADARAAETSFVMGDDAPVIKAHFKKAAGSSDAGSASESNGASSSSSSNASKSQDAANARRDADGIHSPSTGDALNVIAPVGLVVVATVVIIGAIVVRRKK